MPEVVLTGTYDSTTILIHPGAPDDCLEGQPIKDRGTPYQHSPGGRAEADAKSVATADATVVTALRRFSPNLDTQYDILLPEASCALRALAQCCSQNGPA